MPPTREWVALPNHESIDGNKVEKNIEKMKNEKSNIEFFKLTTEENVTMDGWIIKPDNFDSTKKYPVVFYVYTEPASQTVKDDYGSQYNFLYQGNMAADGYIQISLDGRGTPAPKGAAWRKIIYKQLGRMNVKDQALASKQIINRIYVDAGF